MTRILIEELSFSYGPPLFERLSLTFESGWSGLVGANGSGKTTLLRLLTGELQPLAGRVHVAPQGTVAWCRQQSHDQRTELEPFAADTSAAAHRWRGLLDVDSASLERWEQLSAGERKRWQLAQVLAQEPDVLLLDEPTNHLDEAARHLLQQALARFRGVGILVSHDRALLDALTRRTLRIVGGLAGSSIELCPGNYTASARQWQARREATVAAKTSLQQEQRRVAQRRHAQRERALQANAQRNTSRRMKDANDSDARSILAQNRAESAARRLAQDASALASRLGRLEQELAGLHVERERGSELFADYTPWPKPHVLRLELGGGLHAGERRLLGPCTLDVGRQDKLVVRGPNGTGKTQLLRELERQNPRAFACSLHLAQSLPEGARQELGARLRNLPAIQRGRVLQLVACLGSDPAAVLASSAWSPGETRKVALALGLAAQVPALILDEPTNHFDLPSIERLERLLQAFPGCLVLVTHDPVLAQRVATRTLELRGGELHETRPAQPAREAHA
ncbi:MAG: hypothetical protein RL033_6086 [Pseudomonadota bacterium]